MRLAPARPGITARRNAVKRPSPPRARRGGAGRPGPAPMRSGWWRRTGARTSRGPSLRPTSKPTLSPTTAATSTTARTTSDRDLPGVGEHPAVHHGRLAGQDEPEEQRGLAEDQAGDDQQRDPGRYAEQRVDDLLQHQPTRWARTLARSPTATGLAWSRRWTVTSRSRRVRTSDDGSGLGDLAVDHVGAVVLLVEQRALLTVLGRRSSGHRRPGPGAGAGRRAATTAATMQQRPGRRRPG